MRKLIALIVLVMFCQQAEAQTSFKSLIGDVEVGDFQDTGELPIITWGGEAATFLANGGVETKPDSIFGQAGLKFKLMPGDDFVGQVKSYMGGRPWIRGTFRMMCMAAEVMNSDPRTKPVMVLQLTYSQGDHLVGSKDIKTLNDLKGKRVAIQQGGPHMGLLADALEAAGMSFADITPVWCKDLTASDDSPAEKMRGGEADAATVITPDMIGLCSGLDQTGSGAEGTVEGSHVVVSTATMNRSIADVYCVRKDYFDAHQAEVEKFVVGYLKGTEELLKLKKAYNDGQGSSPEYVNVLKMVQKIFTQEVIPTLEEDAHGLVLDANFVRIPGNEAFFSDPNNLVGFAAKQTSGLDLAVALGYSTQKMGFETAPWDYKKISIAVGVKYVEPVYAVGRIKAEVTDFGMDLEDDTVFTFQVLFEPEQISFPVETYAADFQRFAKSSATFGNAAIIIEGHSDPTLALQQFFWASKAKGLITGSSGSYKFKGQPLDLTNTDFIVQAITMENLGGQQRRSRSGQITEIPDPKRTVAAALTLSKSRATAVKAAIEQFATQNSLNIDLSQALPMGVGIADPAVPKPTSMNEAKKNMRVVFRVVKVSAEALSEDDFNFDE
jgi:hypothetical protein